MPLTDIAVKKLKPRANPFKVPDERALYLLVQVGGSKLWRLNYRFDAKQKTLALGAYPDVSLADAREARDAARKLLAKGIDPGVERQKEKADRRAASANTFEAVASEWLSKQIHAPITRMKQQAFLDAYLLPELGRKTVHSIRAPDVLTVLRKPESEGKLETAARVKQLAGRVFRYAVATGRIDSDPTSSLRGAIKSAKVTHHPALLEPEQIAELLKRINGYGGSAVTCTALKLAPLLFVRPGELRHAEWAEIDLDASEWRIPPGKMKMRRAHVVPLSSQAVELLQTIKSLTGRGVYVFPGLRSPKRPMSENTITAALRGLGYTGDEMTGHGFRAMARTRLVEMDWPAEVIERQLAHRSLESLGGAYDRAEHLPMRKQMMQSWSDYLAALTAGVKPKDAEAAGRRAAA